MSRPNHHELRAFVTVARERSFTRAAAQLGVSASALSHAMSQLEARMGTLLLTRTTRSVAPTEAGERMLASVAPLLDDLDQAVDALRSANGSAAGTVRINANDHVISTVLWPKLQPVLRAHPEICVEFTVDYAFTDIVANNFDLGIRIGNRVDQDMIAVRIGPDLRLGAGCSPGYLAGRKLPKHPRDLTSHECIQLRLPTRGGLYAWDFEKGKESLNVRVQGKTIFNNTFLMLQAALDGQGVCYVPEDLMLPHFASGALVPLLENWWPVFPGYHLYYPNRRHLSPALRVVIDALRHHVG